jgi:zinc transporter
MSSLSTLPDREIGPGLIWGMDFTGATAVRLSRCDSAPQGGFRWLHFNLADHGTRHWLKHEAGLPPEIRELFLSGDTHQRAVVEGASVGCVLHDFERDFDVADTERVGALRIALTPACMITARHHPLRSADIARNRLERATGETGPVQALDLLAGAIAGNISDIGRGLAAKVQHAEEAFLDGRSDPVARDLIHIRRRLAQLHRLLSGMRAVFLRLEADEDLPEDLLPAVEKQVQRLHSLEADVAGTQAQLRLLREEVDMQAAQRTNQNLYILSIVTALMLPATLVTGIFGMNTGGMPFATDAHGTLTASAVALGAAAATYFMLRWMGFMRR